MTASDGRGNWIRTSDLMLPKHAQDAGNTNEIVAVDAGTSEGVTVAVPTRGGQHRSERRALKEARSRCFTPSNKDYADYGARGIRVWDGWLGHRGFAVFLAHIGPKPSPRHTLDRVDNTRGYEPGNVRWATWVEQANNRRSSRMVEWDGRVMTAAELAREVGIRRQEVVSMANDGWFALPEVAS